MGLKQQMIGILRSDETRRIHFSFTGTNGSEISVDHTSFQRVATALENNQLHLVEGYFSTDKAMYSAQLDLDARTAANTFYFGRNPRWSRNFNALVVHESLHASFDLTRTVIPWVDNEVAAYIAQGYYLRNSGYRREWLDFGSSTSVGYSIVNNILAGEEGDPAYFISALRDSLYANPLYHRNIRLTFSGDG